MRPEEIALDAHQIPVAAGEVHADVETGRLADEERGREDGHPDAPQRPVVDVHDLDAALGEELRALHELLDVVAARRIELHRDQELPGVEPREKPGRLGRHSQHGSLFQLGPDARRHRHGAPRAVPSAAVGVHHLAHGADVGGGRPAAAAHHPRAGVQHARRVVGHVGRRREVDQPLSVTARQAGVRPDREPRPRARPRGRAAPRRRARSSPRRSWRRSPGPATRRARARSRPAPGPRKVTCSSLNAIWATIGRSAETARIASTARRSSGDPRRSRRRIRPRRPRAAPRPARGTRRTPRPRPACRGARGTSRAARSSRARGRPCPSSRARRARAARPLG